ncbi:MAG: DAK2 domain-containing protein, partial [Legionella sp.]|nr:DAK2 domain-containing protein [Legionella sp.]
MSDAPAVTVDEVVAWLRDFAAVMAQEKDALTALDAAIGDGDHGINMDRGMRAVIDKVDAAAPADVPALMKAVGMALISKVGGAAGPLYGTLFLQFGAAAGPDGLTPEGWAACLGA